MPVLKFNQCDYDCRDKRDKRGSFRVYCRRVESECGKRVKDTKKKPWFRKEEHELTSFDFPGGVSQYLEHISAQPPHILLLEQYTDAFLYKKPIGSGPEVEAIIKNQWMNAIEKELSYGNPIPLPVLNQYQKLRVTTPKANSPLTQRIVVMRGGPGSRKLQTMAACLKQNNIEYVYQGEAATSGFGIAEITINEQDVPKARECGWRVSRKQWATRKGPISSGG